VNTLLTLSLTVGVFLFAFAAGWCCRALLEHQRGDNKRRRAGRKVGYVTAFAVMRMSTKHRSLGQISTSEHRARAKARQIKAEGRDKAELVRYEAVEVLEI